MSEALQRSLALPVRAAVAVLLYGAACWGWSRTAYGQSAEQGGSEGEERMGSETSASPPKLVGAMNLPRDVEAPAGQSWEVELLVDEQGRVAQVREAPGSQLPPPATLALIRAWHFSPGRGAEGAPLPMWTRVTLAPQNAEAQSQPVEVTVVGRRSPGVSSTVTRESARATPGAFGDPLRALEASPGVVPIYSGLPFFFVRGAPPGGTSFYLDGIRVPLLYHAVLGPSVVHPALIERVELYSGPAPAQYGRSTGGIVLAETRPPLARAGGEANLRLFDGGGLIDVPVWEGRGSVMASGRYSFAPLLVSLLGGPEIHYWDYAGRVTRDLGEHHTLTLFGFGSYDYYADDTIARHGAVQFHRIDLRHDWVTANSEATTALTLGYDRTGASGGDVTSRSVALRHSYQRRLEEHWIGKVGGDVEAGHYALALSDGSSDAADTRRLFPTRNELVGGAFAELQWRPAASVTVVPGVRGDAYRVGGQSTLGADARLRAEFRAAPWLTTFQSIGLTHQRPDFVPQVPAAQVGSLDGGLQRALQASGGARVTLPHQATLGVTWFRTQFTSLVDPIGTDHQLDLQGQTTTARSDGRAYGVELLLRRDLTQRVGGFLAYTWSRSFRNTPTAQSVAAFDRPHVLQAAISARLASAWYAGARLAAWSGIPARLLGSSAAKDSFSSQWRGPAYYRVDLRLERRFRLTETSYWSVVGEVLNATANQEVTSRTCSATRCEEEHTGPFILPSLGVEAYWY